MSVSGLIAGLFMRRTEKRDYEAVLKEAGWGAGSPSGMSVTASSALGYSAVFACVRILAESVAQLPLIIYERAGRARRRAEGHYLHPILHDSPNEWMTAVEFRETMQGHLALRGNAYAQIEYDERGQVVSLFPLHPDSIWQDVLENGKRRYLYQLPGSGGMRWLAGEQVWHLRGLGSDGLRGYSPIGLHKRSIGLGLAADEFGARFFGNGARPGGVLEHPGKLTDPAHDRLRESWEESHQGLTKSHKVAILEEGLKYHQIGIAPDEAQFLETRKFNVTDIARIFRVPPHMVGDLERATFSNIEHQGIEFVSYSLGIWLERWEQSIQKNLMLAAERKRFYAEHLVDGLLRGDAQARNQSYAIGKQWGWLSTNDIREKENLNPIEGGDIYWMPLNMIPAGRPEPAVREVPVPPGNLAAWLDQQRQVAGSNIAERRSLPAQIESRDAAAAQHRHRMQGVYRQLYLEAAQGVLRAEAKAILKGAEQFLARDSIDFRLWLDDFYRELAEAIIRRFGGLALDYGQQVSEDAYGELGTEPEFPAELEQFIDKYNKGYAGRHIEISKSLLLDALQQANREGVDPLEAVRDEVEDWEETRSAVIADEESVRFNNATAKKVYVLLGVERLMSVAFGENCPYCEALNGTIVGITANFINAGESFQPEGVDEPLTSTTNLGHAPYHGGCLLGDARVLADGIMASSKRWFDGNIVVFRTAAGYQLSCTENHPILTPLGWIGAGRLNKGSRVISTCGREWITPIKGDYKNMPPRIEQIAESFGDASEMITRPVPASTINFHSDWFGSQIAIIRTNRKLWNGRNIPNDKHFGESNFVGRLFADCLPCPRGHTLLFESFYPASGSLMSSRSLPLPLDRSHLAGTQQTSFAMAADLDISFHQALVDGRAPDTEFVRQFILGFSGEIFLDEIISIERKTFHGYVYNLQTEKGFYVANGIITHNCDCMVIAA